MTRLTNIWKEEQGQDLIEYTLLLSFLALASAALLIDAGASIKGVWTTANTGMANVNAGFNPGL